MKAEEFLSNFTKLKGFLISAAQELPFKNIFLYYFLKLLDSSACMVLAS